ncbi:MAG: N-acetylmuramic acid 6-phosphate etherase [Lachnospiraceae bacterium]|jgi:N-acetylmuramic acid 6-phosphate etherase|nr:N-acetylmuramic acid 6-phosphate etherase [Lachnospiraceae bacterium]
MNWEDIKTEERNANTKNIDALETADMLKLINSEDKKVAEAVEKEIPQIAKAVDIISEHFKKGGRLIYCGAGTSGRLGILDAVECPPTFSTEPEQVVGLIAGGYPAIFKAVEGAEDSPELGENDLKELNFTKDDVLVGIAASGRTPYVIGCMKYAKSVGAPVLSVTCCPGSDIANLADVSIAPTPGPEVITGSTRLKSGTAQKLVLNMLTTGSMIKLGKVYGNLMVDVKPSNEKLIHRCKKIVSDATGVTIEEAEAYLDKCGYRPKVAIVMILCGVDSETAKDLLKKNDERISKAVEKR